MMSWAARVSAVPHGGLLDRRRAAELAIMYLMAVQASLCCASQLVVSLMTRRATARESCLRSSRLKVVGRRLKSGLGAVEGSGITFGEVR